MSVTVHGNQYLVKVKSGKQSLDLRKKKISDISEIQWLESLTELQELNLGTNAITEIKGLEALANLRILDLSYNQITEVKGLENLTQLQDLILLGNPVLKWAYEQFGGNFGGKINGQAAVDYCQKHVKT
jgi:Leucine-rich repeat (LRR) protein